MTHTHRRKAYIMLIAVYGYGLDTQCCLNKLISTCGGLFRRGITMSKWCGFCDRSRQRSALDDVGFAVIDDDAYSQLVDWTLLPQLRQQRTSHAVLTSIAWWANHAPVRDWTEVSVV